MEGGVAYFDPLHQEKHMTLIFTQCLEPKCFLFFFGDGKSLCAYS